MFSIALLLFCFQISNWPTRIPVAVTLVMVAALIAWCIHSSWESSDERGVWLNNLLPSVTHALDHVRVTCKRMFALPGARIRQENPSSITLDDMGSVRPASSHEGTEIVAV